MCLNCVRECLKANTTIGDIKVLLGEYHIANPVRVTVANGVFGLTYCGDGVYLYSSPVVCEIHRVFDGEYTKEQRCSVLVSDSSTAADCERFLDGIPDVVATEPVTATTTEVVAQSDGYTNRDDIRIGYELECDSWDTSADDGELDEEAYDTARTEWVDNNMPDTSYLSDRTIDRVRDDLWDASSEHIDSSEYMSSSGDWGYIDNELSGFRAHRDGTVEGPEIVLATPQGIDKAKAMTGQLFTYIEHHEAEINKGCSFHVHVSVQGRKHVYGTGFQALMIDYVFQQALAGRLPTRLLDRWCNGSLSSYFDLSLESGKYEFIAHRPEHGTWEFRCFGNIDNATDAKTCIDVAVEAYCWAYAMTRAHGTATAVMRVFDTTLTSSLVRMFRDLLENQIESQLTKQRNIDRGITATTGTEG